MYLNVFLSVYIYCVYYMYISECFFLLFFLVHCSRRQLEGLVSSMRDAVHTHSWPSHYTEPAEDCAVCLSPCVTEKFRSVCGHWFCHSCQMQWLIQSNSCPLCRRIIFWDREEVVRNHDHLDQRNLEARNALLQDSSDDSDLDDLDLDDDDSDLDDLDLDDSDFDDDLNDPDWDGDA